MSDVNCPYCGKGNEINHDDGYGYEEGTEFEQECTHCRESFKFYTSISYNYEVHCRDGDHEMEPFGDEWPGMYECEKCDFYERVKEEADCE